MSAEGPTVAAREASELHWIMVVPRLGTFLDDFITALGDFQNVLNEL